jgi:hypothetical protein
MNNHQFILENNRRKRSYFPPTETAFRRFFSFGGGMKSPAKFADNLRGAFASYAFSCERECGTNTRKRGKERGMIGPFA